MVYGVLDFSINERNLIIGGLVQCRVGMNVQVLILNDDVYEMKQDKNFKC